MAVQQYAKGVGISEAVQFGADPNKDCSSLAEVPARLSVTTIMQSI